MNKKGAELTIGTIVIIILALVLLVVIIYGFTTGWGNLWENLIGFGGGSVNVQTVIQSCQVACTTNGQFDYCKKQRKVIFDENRENKDNGEKFTCLDLELKNIGLRCDTMDCGDIVSEEGVCQGTISADPGCSGKNNLGEDSCEALIGCEWKSANLADTNVGTCEFKEVPCSNYNDDSEKCKSLENSGCNWVGQ